MGWDQVLCAYYHDEQDNWTYEYMLERFNYTPDRRRIV